jgi:hypothetical protein
MIRRRDFLAAYAADLIADQSVDRYGRRAFRQKRAMA